MKDIQPGFNYGIPFGKKFKEPEDDRIKIFITKRPKAGIKVESHTVLTVGIDTDERAILGYLLAMGEKRERMDIYVPDGIASVVDKYRWLYRSYEVYKSGQEAIAVK